MKIFTITICILVFGCAFITSAQGLRKSIEVKDAKNYAGDSVTFCGIVSKVRELGNNKIISLSVHDLHDTTVNILVLVNEGIILSKSVKKIHNAKDIKGDFVCICGIVELDSRKKMFIRVVKPNLFSNVSQSDLPPTD